MGEHRRWEVIGKVLGSELSAKQAAMLLELHHWLGDDQPMAALIGGIDDATGDVPHGEFREAETTEGYMRVLRQVVQKRGVPLAVYTDRDSVFVVNDRRERQAVRDRGREPLTQFGRALKELGIQWIPASSPQAKGRIERLWGTLQDRLLNELRLEGIKTYAAANHYLMRFLARYNRQFRRKAARPELAYRPAPLHAQREAIFCWKEPRVVAGDHTFKCGPQVWQVLPTPGVYALVGRRIEVRRTLRGTTEAWFDGRRLRLRPAPLSPPLDTPAVAGAGTSRIVVPTTYPHRARLHLSRRWNR